MATKKKEKYIQTMIYLEPDEKDFVERKANELTRCSQSEYIRRIIDEKMEEDKNKKQGRRKASIETASRKGVIHANTQE